MLRPGGAPQAEVGIAMGGGVDAAAEVASIVLLGDRPMQVPPPPPPHTHTHPYTHTHLSLRPFFFLQVSTHCVLREVAWCSCGSTFPCNLRCITL